MTLPATYAEAAAGIADPVGTRLLDLSSTWNATLLLEDESGRVVSHAVSGAVPACVVDAVVTRCIAPLERARGAASSLGLMSGGPVLVTRLAGWPGNVTVLPVLRTGRLWVLHSEDLPLSVCAPAAQSLVEVVERIGARASDEALLDALQGRGSWAASAALSGDVCVVAVTCLEVRVPAVELHAALRQSFPASTRAAVTAMPGTAYVVVRATTRQVLDTAIEDAGERLGIDLAAAFAPVVEGLVVARSEADRALAARAEAGRCLSLDDCRPYTVLPALLEALDATAPLGADPLAELDPTYAVTLLAWLDDHGDLPAAAARLGVHPNTFRYRLSRAREQVRADLHDPVARIDIHLRLHRLALPAQGPS
ncbi:MAG: putative transcriptional regulator, PucR family [Frankiales bacterium]|nr:putative transcriptional regulator, PucR family [Frankiales bacterium]